MGPIEQIILVCGLGQKSAVQIMHCKLWDNIIYNDSTLFYLFLILNMKLYTYVVVF